MEITLNKIDDFLIKGDDNTMKSIFASKLYQASNRKDRIHAALQSPSNLALVQQLATSLDEEYKTPENIGVKDTEPAEEEKTESLFVDEEIDPEKDLVTVDDLADSMKKPSSNHKPVAHRSSSSGSKPSEEGPSENKSKADTSDLMPDSPMNEEPKKEEPAEASTKITSCTCVDLNVVKGTLNGREDLAGVTRVAEKENEIWIYYKDDVNLNNIMTDVIEHLMTTGYDYFEFNRLARSDNAIVFVYNRATNDYPSKHLDEDEK